MNRNTQVEETLHKLRAVNHVGHTIEIDGRRARDQSGGRRSSSSSTHLTKSVKSAPKMLIRPKRVHEVARPTLARPRGPTPEARSTVTHTVPKTV
jgi:hypothetical protein